jgi:hypothetical protein
MKAVIHARLSADDREVLDALKRETGLSDTELVRRGLRLVQRDLGRTQSALTLAGRSVGKFRSGVRDLATNPKHLDDFGR